MKTALFGFFFLFATAAFGQSAVGGGAMSAQTSMLQMPNNPQRASRKAMGNMEDLREDASFVHARGERPLWEVAPESHVMPLGDAARILKKEHETAKKSEIIYVN